MKNNLIIILIFVSSCFLGQEENKELSLREIFNSDTIDVFIEKKSCWGDHPTTIINIRKSADKYVLLYSGGEPNIKKMQKIISLNQIQEINELVRQKFLANNDNDAPTYLDIYIQTPQTHIEFATEYNDFGKKLDKILSVR